MYWPEDASDPVLSHIGEPKREDGLLVPEMSRISPTEIVITHSIPVSGEEAVNHFFEEGWSYKSMNGIFI